MTELVCIKPNGQENKKILLIGGAVVAAGTAVYLITRKKDEEESGEKSIDIMPTEFPSPLPDDGLSQNVGPQQVTGCTNPDALNYDPSATQDDGSCDFGMAVEAPTSEIVYGCTDPDAQNFEQGATNNDGSCEYLFGCTNTQANNYDPDAFLDNGLCEFSIAPLPESQVVYGCMDELASNYNPSATNADNSCTYIEGCKLSGAANYNPDAMIDDGSCVFPSTLFVDADPVVTAIYQVCPQFWSINIFTTITDESFPMSTADVNAFLGQDCMPTIEPLNQFTSKNFMASVVVPIQVHQITIPTLLQQWNVRLQQLWMYKP